MNEEQKYYEEDSFWNPQNIKNEDSKRIKNTFEFLPKDIKSIADIGCGNGIFVNYVQKIRKDLKLIGVDNSESALKYVETKTLKQDIETLPFKDEEYDLSISLEVIEHLSEPIYDSVLRELARVSKKYIVISVPNNEFLKNNFVQCPKCLTEFSASYHKRSFNKAIMKKLFLPYNFKCRKVDYLGPKKEYIFLSSIYRFLYRKSIIKRKYKPYLCPLCGYSNIKNYKKSKKANSVRKENKLKKLIKNIWPYRIEYRWIIALYEREQ